MQQNNKVSTKSKKLAPEFAGLENSEILKKAMSPSEAQIKEINRVKKLLKEINEMSPWAKNAIWWGTSNESNREQMQYLGNAVDSEDGVCDMQNYILALGLTEEESNCNTILAETIRKLE
jgi:hypothetical protein